MDNVEIVGTSPEDFKRRARAVSSGDIYLPKPNDRLYFHIGGR
jgi:hypothetical protein